MILDSKKIDYEKIDISSSEKLKNEMREIMGDPKGVPPQLAKGHQYLGVSKKMMYCCSLLTHQLPRSPYCMLEVLVMLIWRIWYWINL